MPQTQSLLEEELRRGSGNSAGWPWRLLMMTVILLAFTVVVYFGLELGYRPYMGSQVRQLDGEIEKLNASISEGDKKSLLLFYSRLNNINNLLKEQTASSKIFSLLSETAVRGAYYRAATIDTERRVVSLDGVATTYKTLTEQLTALKNNAGVTGVDLKGSQHSRDLGGVSFSIVITLAPSALSQ